MASLLDELRRRNVLKVAAAYALVAWILIEAGSVLLPTFGAPKGFFQTYVIIIICGWVVSLLIAWVFEVTPEGVKLERDIDREDYAPARKGRMNTVIIALLATALAVSISFNVSGIRERDAGNATQVSQKSIAVLPFESRSADPENRFFTDGIHEDLLTRLSSIESLRVISRPSVMEYRETTKNLRQIGAELDVATVVRGAVQQNGENVRITVQLLDTATDEHLWAKSYDRDLTAKNLFDVQSEISAQIAEALRAALSPEDALRLAAVPTLDIDAYTSYAAGRMNLYQRRYEAAVLARRQFEEALQLDPDYAEAHAGLAEAVMLLLINHKAIAPEEAYDVATRATRQALELDPDLAVAHALAGLIAYEQWQHTRLGNGNQRAAASFRRAIELNPSYADAYIWYANLLRSEGKFDDGIKLLQTALQKDPKSRIPYVNLPEMLAAKGENEQAIRLLVKAMTIFPDWPTPYDYMTEHLQRMGRFDESIAWSRKAVELSDDPITGASVLPIYYELGYYEQIEEFVDSFPDDHALTPVGIGYVQFLHEQYEQAIETLGAELNETEWPVDMVYPVLIRAAILLGDYDLAHRYLLQGVPSLAADTLPRIDRISIGAVVLLAFLEQKRGNATAADRLLVRAYEAVQEMPRSGLWGHGIKDVKILAMQGRSEAALDALRDAIDEGFVSTTPFDLWSIDRDPMIDRLRDLPRYQELRREMDVRLEALRQRLELAFSSGDWQSLRDRAQTI